MIVFFDYSALTSGEYQCNKGSVFGFNKHQSQCLTAPELTHVTVILLLCLVSFLRATQLIVK